MTKKAIIFGISTLLLLGIGVLICLVLPKTEKTDTANPVVKATPIDTSDWETYRNEKFGYEIKYPKGAIIGGDNKSSVVDFYIDDYFGVSGELKEERRVKIGAKRGYLINISVSVQKVDNPDHLSISDWMLFNQSYVIKESFNPEYPKYQQDVTFLGLSAFYLEKIDRGIGVGTEEIYSFKSSSTYFFHNDYLFNISFRTPPLNPTSEWKSHPYYKYLEQSTPITKAIIKSFRFTD